MRASEFIHYINRKDVGLGRNVKNEDYTHLTIKSYTKRVRYNYQLNLRRQNKCQKNLKKES